jgi:CDP-diacylglycerol--glycerol-3-phosphate 3-phosphatidyltransferase
MISIYKIKPAFQQLLVPVLKMLHRQGVTANQITLSSILLSLIIGACFWEAATWPVLFWALPIGLFVRMALNALDGMMARTFHQQSKKGELLNELGDVIADLFIYFPLVKHEKNNLYLVVVFICCTIVNEFAGLLAKVVSGQRRYDGPMGKSDRAFVIGVYGILAFFGLITAGVSFWLFLAVNVLVLVSTTIRIKHAISPA